MKIKKIMILIMFTLFGYGCANGTANSGVDNTEYLDVFFTYYKQGEDPSKAVDLKIPKDTQTFLITQPIIINFKNQDDSKKYRAVNYNDASQASQDVEFPYEVNVEGDNIIEVINNEGTGQMAQIFNITYAPEQ